MSRPAQGPINQQHSKRVFFAAESLTGRPAGQRSQKVRTDRERDMLGMKFARKYISRLELLTYQRADKLKQEARHFAVCVIS